MGTTQTTQSILPAWAMEITSQPSVAPPPQCLTSQGPRTKKVSDRKTSKRESEEGELIRLALEGHLDSLSTLFGRDRVRLYRAAYSLLRNREDAEDALQDGLLSAYINLRSFEGRSQFSTWLTRIVLNAALMKRRKLRTLAQTSLDDDEVEGVQPWNTLPIDTRPDPEHTYALAETKELMEKVMSQLSPVLQSAIQSRDAEHPSNEDAETPSVNRNTYKSRLSRARQRLAHQLATKGVELRYCCF
jgi:RNA polymerase sigma-70 factor (ECF subfamily)